MSALSVLHRLSRIVRDGLGLLLTLAAGALVFLLFTEAGARLALREVEARLDSVRTEQVGGRLWGPLTAGRFVYEDDTVRIEIRELSLDWSLLQALRARLAFSELHAGELQLVVKPRSPDEAPAEPGGMLTRLPLDLAVGDLRVDRFEIVAGEGEPIVLEDVSLAAGWRGERVRIDALQATTPWVGTLDAAGEAHLQPDAVVIDALRVGGFVDASVEGRYGYDTPSDLRLQWTALHWPPAADADPQFASDGGRLHWQGVPDAWQFELEGALAAAGETLQVEAAGSGTLDAVELSRARVDSGYGRVDARASLRYAGLELKADGRVEALEPQHWAPQFEGLIQGDFDVEAMLGADEPELRFDVQLDDSRLQGHTADVEARGRYRGQTLVFERLDARVGRNRLRLSGQVLPELAAEAQVDGRDLAALLPELAGSLRGRVRADGPLQRPRLAGELEASGLYYGTYGSERLQARFDLDPAQRLTLDVRAETVAAGTPIDSVELALRGSAQDHRLTLDARLPQAHLATTLTGALDIAARRWAGQLAAAQIEPRGFPAFALEEAAALSVAEDVVELAPACLKSELARVCTALRPVDGARRVAFRLQDLELAMLEPWLGGLQAEGAIEGRGYVDLGPGGLQDLRLDLDSSRLRLTRAGLPPLVLLPGTVRVVENEQALDLSAELPLERGGLTLAGRLAPGDDFLQRGLEGELRVEVPELTWLHVLNFEMQEARGRLSGRISASGTLSEPRFDGRVEFADASMRLRTPGIRLERIRALVSGSSSGALEIDAEAWSGDGVLRAAGQFDPWRRPFGLNLKIDGQDFQAVRTPDASVWVTPRLDVALAEGALRVDGTVDVPRADITPKRISSGVGPSTDQVIVRRGEDGGADAVGIFADVRLKLGEAVRFEGFGLKTRLSGAIRVIEAPGVPTRARGELQLVGGRYEAYGQELTLETGKLLFTGGALTRPAVQLRATREPREDITVGVLVRGTLDKPEFSLFSTPAMPQERQLSWLVLGRSLDEGGSGSDRELVADAALGLGLAGGEWLAQRLGSRIGFDEITVGAKPGESSQQAQITLGKYLSPRLFISYGVGLFQAGQSFRLQYDIGSGFKLATETGVESGGDLLYTIER